MDNCSDNKDSGLPDWLWALLIVIPALVIIRVLYWWLLVPSYRRHPGMEIDAPRKIQIPEQEEKRDDLTLLKGVGPKTAQALEEAGVLNFTQLVLLPREKLENALQHARARMTNIDALQHQARLAANQEWKDLAVYQDEL